MSEAWIIDAARTPRGRGRKDKGALASVHPQELLAQTLNRLAEKTGVERRDVEDVVIGCVSQAGEQGACIARSAVLLAGWPQEVTGVTMNRFCGSGLQAVNTAAMGIMAGQQELTVGGGVESMSRQPMGSDGAGLDGNNLRLREIHPMVPQGISADLIATIEGFGRADVDRFAALSQRNAEVAQKEGRFAKSLFPVRDPEGKVLLEADEHPRHGTTLENLAGLKPSFEVLGATPVTADGKTLDDVARTRYPQVSRIEHVHTAGNSSGIVDGACAVLLCSPGYAKAHGLRPRGRILATATFGDEPVIMLTAPGPASRRALDKAKMKVSDVDLWEINEAFAVVPMKMIRDLAIDPARVNPNGGAIALGHPLGATGAMLLATALDELERRDLATALVTLCIGGGMAVATIIERI
ncbi:MAG: acetyl-CoA C-acetyltransferase [Deltaproteobacteria bacterium]|nr:acetyl-CoA C-acetyltransferase [Deltaproteobacteria bacterium]